MIEKKDCWVVEMHAKPGPMGFLGGTLVATFLFEPTVEDIIATLTEEEGQTETEAAFIESLRQRIREKDYKMRKDVVFYRWV